MYFLIFPFFLELEKDEVFQEGFRTEADVKTGTNLIELFTDLKRHEIQKLGDEGAEDFWKKAQSIYRGTL